MRLFHGSLRFCPAYRLLGYAAVILVFGIYPAKAQTLYDASLGTLPSAQGWSFAAFGSAPQTLINNSVRLDTTASTSTQAGYTEIAPTTLNHTNGFTLLFTVQLLEETHPSTNRAGFSVILLANDKHGIELGFWTNLIFAQTDNPMFIHGEDTAIVTTNTFVHYALTLLATNYVLRANGTTILTGRSHDYTAFTGLPNPYSTPNFIFFGDDTMSASASVQIQNITLVTAPTLKTSAPGVVSWSGVSNQTYNLQTSSDFTSWSAVTGVTSATTNFSYTNLLLPGRSFFRLSYP
jgi:hypothetical protein